MNNLVNFMYRHNVPFTQGTLQGEDRQYHGIFIDIDENTRIKITPNSWTGIFFSEFKKVAAEWRPMANATGFLEEYLPKIYKVETSQLLDAAK